MKNHSKNIVIIGATSAIATEVARRYADNESRFFLVARNEGKLKAVVADLTTRGGAVVAVHIADLRNKGEHSHIVYNAITALGTIDIVLIAHGVLPDQAAISSDVEAGIETLLINGLSPISIAHHFALCLQKQGSGSLVVISSVAGDRGRQGNYMYGAAKAALTTYVAGLRGQLRQSGVHILTVKPGPVATPMTEGREQPFIAQVGVVATDIIRGIEKKKLNLYTPWFWRYIMLLFKVMPERLVMRITN